MYTCVSPPNPTPYFRSSPLFADVSLVDAGKNKGLHRLGVYSGGWAAAFVLDMEIHHTTDGQRTLHDSMRVMLSRFESAKTPYTIDDVVAVASEVAAADMNPFFRRYVIGTEMLPIEEALRRAGFDVYRRSVAACLWCKQIVPGSEKERPAEQVLLLVPMRRFRRRVGHELSDVSGQLLCFALVEIQDLPNVSGNSTIHGSRPHIPHRHPAGAVAIEQHAVAMGAAQCIPQLALEDLAWTTRHQRLRHEKRFGRRRVALDRPSAAPGTGGDLQQPHFHETENLVVQRPHRLPAFRDELGNARVTANQRQDQVPLGGPAHRVGGPPIADRYTSTPHFVFHSK